MNWTAALALMTSPALATLAPGVSWDWQLSDPFLLLRVSMDENLGDL